MFLEKIIIPNAADNVASISNIDITIPPKVFQRKIVFAGSDVVGKTSLIRVCAGMEFEYYSKDNLDNVNIDVNVDVNVFGGSVELQLVDSRYFGNSFNMNHLCSYTDGIFIVFDINDLSTFDSTLQFIDDILPKVDQKPMILLGNKYDYKSEDDIKYIRERIEKYDIKFFEVSAESNYNMDCALKQMAEELVNNSLHQMTKIRNLINKNLIKDNTKKICTIY